METIAQNKIIPTFSGSFGNGWNVMKKYFLILLLVVIVLGVIMGPSGVFNWKIDPTDHGRWDWHMPDIGLIALGMFTVVLALFALAYTLLIVPVFKYGGKMMFLQAVRDTRPDFNTLVRGFRENYLSIVLANLLAIALVMLGVIALIVPGIIIGCRLAFVGYLVMDKKLDPIVAVEESWKLTRGHGWTIFFMAIASFFIFIAGFCLVFVGVFPAAIWVGSSFASLYEAVLAEKEAKSA
jgi:hypothetical protein